ncbi:hypothetical protein BGT96_15740 [Clostridioides difficile]|uniref:hypothetical protein n=1 Tax=Clostridioides difficile TaxID=1496 RepID=UPI000BB168E4|nr:hypothetical protein [Clostridioides difficile]MBY2557779.1 hypothetical protein [Clostridioides difficile]MCI0936754.1 hypothetical protein [Clostridioides difficile]MCI4304761.1 hypothetical protein [Clostridioides difficile]MCL6901932.1 hypothetical protein [Clostridioides difficile]MCM4101565.1 hypothetical protein [Clostridioides difficile]
MIEKELFYNKTNKKIQMYYDLNYKFYNSLDNMRYKKNISIEKVRIKTHLAQLEYNFKIIKYILTSFYISYICSISFISIKYSNFNLLYNVLFILATLAMFCIYITKLHNKNIFYLTALEVLENISDRKLYKMK